MVFPGHFSTGCLRCRKRKIKCDEAKPSCRRCAIYGKPCTGYTDQFHFRHTRNKSMSAPAFKAAPVTPVLVQLPPVHKPRPGSGSSSPTRESGQIVHRRPSSQPRTPRYHDPFTSVARAPEVSYDHVSLCYFVNRFISPDPTDGYPCHLSFLPGLYDDYKHGLLETATLSVAQMATYNKLGGDKFRVQSYQNYGRAIRMLRDAMQSEDQATDDRVIAAILLLCIFEDVSGEESGDRYEHAPGLFYLIEKRGLEQIATSRGCELLFLALIRLVYAFLYEDDTYVDPGSIATCWAAFDPLLHAMSLTSKALSLRQKLLHFHALPYEQQTDPTVQNEHQSSVIQGCFETLGDFQTWDEEAASHWQSTFQGRVAPTALGQAASSGTHYDAETACTIILIRCARLILLMSMIAYIDMAEWAAVLEEEVDMTINDMLACVLYALGDVDTNGRSDLETVSYDGAVAVMIHQPIRLVASCGYATPDQLQTANVILARLNAGIGIRAAVMGIGDKDLKPTRWVMEQTQLRAKRDACLGSPGWIRCPSLGLTEVDTQASPTSAGDTEGLVANVGCAIY